MLLAGNKIYLRLQMVHSVAYFCSNIVVFLFTSETLNVGPLNPPLQSADLVQMI